MADPVTMMLVASTVLSVKGSIDEGNAAEKAGNFEAQQLAQQANARYAQGTREAAESKRQGDITESRARAVMAAGGGSASDSGAIKQLGKIGAETEYNTLAALYEGETEASGLKAKAEAARYEGKVKKRAAHTKALSTALSGGSKAYQSFKAP